MRIVVDSSATIAWLHEDERDNAVPGLLDHVAKYGAVVPLIWFYEVANALTVSVRRKRIAPGVRDGFLAGLSALDIIADDAPQPTLWSNVVRLADRHALTIYDAAYLELALRRGLPLASLDRQLVTAAGAMGVRCLP